MFKSTKQRLDEKIKYLDEKIKSYEQYIQTCLDKHNTGQKYKYTLFRCYKFNFNLLVFIFFVQKTKKFI